MQGGVRPERTVSYVRASGAPKKARHATSATESVRWQGSDNAADAALSADQAQSMVAPPHRLTACPVIPAAASDAT